MATIYNKGGTDKVIICDVREAHARPFDAQDWTDLRVGFFLSLTTAGDDDTPPSAPETISASPDLGFSDRVQIGLTDRATGQTFCGYSNLPYRSRLTSLYDSVLVSSDIGIGTSNTRYWRPKNSSSHTGNNDAVHIIDGGLARVTAGDGSQIHLVQDPSTAGGYCTFLGLRFTRPDARGHARTITMQVKKTVSGHSSDLLFTDTPTTTLAETTLESWPTDVQTLGPVELSQAPDTFYFYWPFHNSRLRIHEVTVLKTA